MAPAKTTGAPSGRPAASPVFANDVTTSTLTVTLTTVSERELYAVTAALCSRLDARNDFSRQPGLQRASPTADPARRRSRTRRSAAAEPTPSSPSVSCPRQRPFRDTDRTEADASAPAAHSRREDASIAC